MKKRRPKRKAPPPAHRPAGPLQYKVAELSTVDEASIERTVNHWVRKGWHLDGIQFAMRESSKRPAMAFILFTREGEPAEHDPAEARERLARLAEDPSPTRAESPPEQPPQPAPGPELDDPAPEPFWRTLEEGE